MIGCTLGVGCDEAGMCYAFMSGHPEQCPLSDSDRSGEAVETAKQGSTEGESAGRKASPNPNSNTQSMGDRE